MNIKGYSDRPLSSPYREQRQWVFVYSYYPEIGKKDDFLTIQYPSTGNVQKRQKNRSTKKAESSTAGNKQMNLKRGMQHVLKGGKLKGMVKRKMGQRGLGFMATGEEEDVFFHVSDCIGSFDDLGEGDAVEFELAESEGRRRAIKVRRIG